MNWPQISKGKFPEVGGPGSPEWKTALAVEANHQCVYCAVRDNALGGIRMFHVEHYRPKSQFPRLEYDYGNMFYSCPVCNSYKGDDWPAEPASDHSLGAYPCPSDVDYNSLFWENPATFEVEGKYAASRYLVVRLHLNRVHLQQQRREYALYREREELGRKLAMLCERAKSSPSCSAKDLQWINIAEDLVSAALDPVQASKRVTYAVEDLRAQQRS